MPLPAAEVAGVKAADTEIADAVKVADTEQAAGVTEVTDARQAADAVKVTDAEVGCWCRCCQCRGH